VGYLAGFRSDQSDHAEKVNIRAADFHLDFKSDSPKGERGGRPSSGVDPRAELRTERRRCCCRCAGAIGGAIDGATDWVFRGRRSSSYRRNFCSCSST